MIALIEYCDDIRRGLKILQGKGRMSNPSERGTGGRAPKGVRSGEGAVPPSLKFFYISYIKMVSFYAFLGDIY